MINDPYAVLGVSRSATPDEIKKAYRKKAKEYHPDLHPNDANAAKKMNEINEAYDMLTNPEKYAGRQQQSGSGGSAYGSSAGGYGSSGSYSGSGGYGNGYGGSGSYGGYGGQNGQRGYQGTGGWYSDFGGFDFGDLFGFGTNASADTEPVSDPSDDADFRAVVSMLRQKQYSAAADRLTRIPSTRRSARWNYLYGLADHGLGDNAHAIDHMQRAVQMDPNNSLYHSLLNMFRRSEQSASWSPFGSAWGSWENEGGSSSGSSGGSAGQNGGRTVRTFTSLGCIGRVLLIFIVFRLVTALFSCGMGGGRGYNTYYYGNPFGYGYYSAPAGNGGTTGK